jgi:hypothetical protein
MSSNGKCTSSTARCSTTSALGKKAVDKKALDTDIVIFLSQDAVAADPNALRNLVGAFQIPSVGRQLPASHQSPPTRGYSTPASQRAFK